MWMLLDEGSIRVCNVDNMWMLLDEGSIRMCNVDIPYVNVIGWRFHKDV